MRAPSIIAVAGRWVLLYVLFAVTLCCSCSAKKLPVQTLTLRTQTGAAVTVAAELARTEQEQSRGFMERTVIPDGTGMLFVYDYDHVMHFWMKNTPHPLSIAYIDRMGVIRDIFDMRPYSRADVASTVSVRYALEVPQGWFTRVGVSVGDTLLLDF